MSSIFDIYAKNPAYFQRMVDFFLHARFRAVRVSFPDKENETMFFTVEGELVNIHNNNLRFKTFTEWYNAVFETSHPLTYINIFKKIYVTKRVNLMEILTTVAMKER